MASTPNFAWPTPDDTDPVGDGALDMRSLGNAIDSTLGDAWIAYTPTFTQGATITKTVQNARYKKIGKTVVVQVYLIATSAGTAANIVYIGLPVNARTGNSTTTGVAQIYDASTNIIYVASAYLDNAARCAFLYQTGNPFGVSPAVTVAASDQFQMTLTYEAA
jgi:hypothetical protein